jgi:hypothetical protein
MQRRTFSALAAATALSPALAAHKSVAAAARSVPLGQIRVDGQLRPVTPAFYARNIVPYPELAYWSHDELEVERRRLLDQSERALARFEPGVTFTRADEDRLQAVTRVINAHRATRAFLAKRDLAEFGFAGVDQLHGNSQRLDCGCVLHYAFDHHLAHAGLPHEHIPHFPLKVCTAHAELAALDFRQHFYSVRGFASA